MEIKSAEEILEKYTDSDDNDGHSFIWPGKAIEFAKEYCEQYINLCAERANLNVDSCWGNNYVEDSTNIKNVKSQYSHTLYGHGDSTTTKVTINKDSILDIIKELK